MSKVLFRLELAVCLQGGQILVYMSRLLSSETSRKKFDNELWTFFCELQYDIEYTIDYYVFMLQWHMLSELVGNIQLVTETKPVL